MPIRRTEKFSYPVLLRIPMEHKIERKKVRAKVDRNMMGELFLFEVHIKETTRHSARLELRQLSCEITYLMEKNMKVTYNQNLPELGKSSLLIL